MARIQLTRGFKFRLYPTPAQEAELEEWSRQLRWLWNICNEQRLLGLSRWHRPPEKGFCSSCAIKYPGAHNATCAWVDYYRQSKEMTALLGVNDQLARVLCSARQETLRDLEKAWRLWRTGRWGKPEFKSRIDSMRIYVSTPKQWKVEAGHLHLGGAAASVGPIKIKQDRPWPGDATWSSCSITRDVEEWYASFPLVYTAEVEKAKGGAVGINRGAVHAIADSYGRVVDSPKYYANSIRKIRDRTRGRSRGRALSRTVKRGIIPKTPEPRRNYADNVQLIARRFSTSAGNVQYQIKKRGGLERAIAYLEAHPPAPASSAIPVPSEGRNRDKARVRLALVHQKVRRQRSWWLHEQSAHYARIYSKIGIEDWSTKDMVSNEPEANKFSTTCKRHGCTSPVLKRRLCKAHYEEQMRTPQRSLHRSILDVGWYELRRQLEYKAPAHGGELRLVQPGLEPTQSFKDKDKSGEAGISSTCSGCGAPIDRASGNQYAYCETCWQGEVGDVNAARVVVLRMLRMQPPAPKSAKAAIKIKGRQKRPVTAEKSSGDASGGDSSVGEPVERGKRPREKSHPKRAVGPR